MTDMVRLPREQPNEETRLAVLAAAAAWLQSAGKIPASAVSLLSSGLQEPARKHHLQALLQVRMNFREKRACPRPPARPVAF